MDGERTLRPIVVARVRPRWESELAALSPVLVRIDKEQNVVEICPGPYERSRAVHVTNALDESATQEDVWRLFESYLDDFLGRINLSIFAYGETGSGKTYTMSSLTLRFLTELLLQKGEYDDFAVSISMVEIDNERIYDLLSTEHVNLTIMNNKVKGAKWANVDNEDECRETLEQCWRRRKTEATELNERSSRSHAVCTIQLDASKAGMSFTSTAHICDLAGSERTGLSAQEGNPNASLTLMSMIVKDIASGRTRHNFRQSKLTHLLQPALTGQCRMGLVFTLNPCTARGATSTVRFAQSMMNMPDAKLVRNPVKMTEAQLLQASATLLEKEAAVKQQLMRAEEQQEAMKRENEMLRQQIKMTVQQNMQVIWDNQQLAESLAKERQQATAQQPTDHGIIQDFLSRCAPKMAEIRQALGSAAGRAGAAADARAGIAPFLETFQNVTQMAEDLDKSYHNFNFARLAQLLPVFAQELGNIVSQRERLLGLAAVLGDGGAAGRDACAELARVVAGCEQMVHGVENLEARARSICRQQMREKELREEIQRLQEETQSLCSNAQPSGDAQGGQADGMGMADSGMQHHIKHIPSQRAYEKLSHICGLSKFCAQQFCRLGGVDKLVLEGLLPFPCSSAEACRTASFVPAFCATHESRDLVRRLGGCHYLAKMLLVEGGSELDDARIHACNAVRELCVGSDANKELFAAEALGTLMDLLTCESQHLQEAALSAVGEILDGCPIAKDIAHNERLIGELLLSSLSQNHRVKLQAAHAIGRLLVDHKDSQRQVSNLELEIAEFDWVPTNGLACLACGLAEEDLEIQLSFAQALLNCVYDDQGNMDILFSDETLQLAGLEPGAVSSCLLRAVAARMCTSTPWSASSVGGLESVVSRVECAFPHYSVVATGKWENQLRGAVEPSDSRYYRNPQYRLLSESATQVMVRIEVEGASSEQEYELSLECFRVPDESAWEVGFGLPCITTAAARKGVLSATVELEAEGFYVVVPSFGKCVDDEDVEFKIAFAANQEVEIERLPFLQGWDLSSSQCTAKGSWKGFWKGGSIEGSPFFWRNPQLVLHRGPMSASSGEDALGSGGGSGATDAVINHFRPVERLLVAIYCTSVPSDPEDSKEESPPAGRMAPGLAAYVAGSIPGGTIRRHLGNLVALGEERSAAEQSALPSSVEAKLIGSGRSFSVFELKMPEDDNLVIVPYAHGKSRADADFTVNCFSTLPGLHLRAYSRSEEWHHFYTYKLKWGPLVQAELSVRLPPGEDGRVRPGAEGSAATAVALRFPGLPSGCLANLQWEEASGAASRRPEADTGVLLDGSCLAFTVGSGSSYRVWVKPSGQASEMGKAVVVQLLSDAPLDLASMPKDVRYEDLSELLPCPIHAAVTKECTAAETGGGSTGPHTSVPTGWGLHAAKAKQTAKNVRVMVHELRKQVQSMRLSHDTLKQQIGSRASSRCTSPRASSSGGPRPNGTNEWDSDFGDSRNEVSSSPYNRSSPPSPPAEDALLGVEVSSLSEIALDKVGYLRTSGRSKSASGVLPSGGALGNGGMPSGGAELPWEKELPSPSRSPRLSNSRRSSVRFAKQDITHHVAADFGGESSQSARTGRRSFDRAVPNVRIVQNPSGGSSPSRRSLDDARLSRLANAGGGTLDSNRFALASPRVSRLSHFDGDRRSASMSGIALPGDGALKQQLDEANLENERLRAKLMELGFNPPSRRPHPPDPDDPHAVWDEHSLAE